MSHYIKGPSPRGLFFEGLFYHNSENSSQSLEIIGKAAGDDMSILVFPVIVIKTKVSGEEAGIDCLSGQLSSSTEI